MAITRLGQVAADMQCNEEFITPIFSSPAVSSTQAKTGTYSIRNSNGYNFGIGFSDTERAVRAGCHHYFQTPGFGTSLCDILYFTLMGSSYTMAYGIQADFGTKEFIYIINNVEYGRFVHDSILPDTWIHFAIAVDLDAGYIGFFLNSEQLLAYDHGGVLSSYGLNAVWAGNDHVPHSPLWIDNFYADRISGSDVYSVPPRKLFYFKSIAGPGTFSMWTPVNVAQNYQAVDDPFAHNSDTDYNHALSGSLIDTFSFNPVNIPTNTPTLAYVIRAVIPQAIVKRNNTAQDATVRLLAYDGGSFGYGSDQSGIPTGYAMVWDRLETQPDGSSWTEDDLNNMEYGYQSRGTFA